MNLSSATTEKLQQQLKSCNTVIGVLIALETLILLVRIYLKVKPYTFATLLPLALVAIPVVIKRNAIKAELKSRATTGIK